MMLLPAGVSGSMVFNGKAEDRQQGAMARNIYYWRNVMEFFLMRHQKDCVSLLDPSGEDPAGYDAVGINWRPTPSRHFSGKRSNLFKLNCCQQVHPGAQATLCSASFCLNVCRQFLVDDRKALVPATGCHRR